MELSPELKAKVLATLKAKQSLPVLPGNDGSGTASGSGSKEAHEESGIVGALTLITDKLERMDSKLDSVATRQDLENTKSEILRDTRAHVSTELTPVRAEIRELRARIEVVENTSGLTPSRPKIDWVKDAADSMYRSVGFFGWDEADSKTMRTKAVMDFMKAHFEDVPFALGFEYKGDRQKGILKSFCHASFINRDQADAVLQSIKGSGFELQNGKGRKLKFDKPKTKVQNKRWYCLKAAEEMLKKDPRTANAQVTIETKMPVRRVLVGKATAFEQEKDDAIGVFTGVFADLSIDLSR